MQEVLCDSERFWEGRTWWRIEADKSYVRWHNRGVRRVCQLVLKRSGFLWRCRSSSLQRPSRFGFPVISQIRWIPNGRRRVPILRQRVVIDGLATLSVGSCTCAPRLNPHSTQNMRPAVLSLTKNCFILTNPLLIYLCLNSSDHFIVIGKIRNTILYTIQYIRTSLTTI